MVELTLRDPGRFARMPSMEAALVAGEAWPTLEGVPREVTSVFATDFEGDGRAELVLNLTQDLYAPTRHRSGSWIARREGDARWTVSRNPDEVGMCRTAADLDDDGDPDLVCVGRAARVMWNEQGRFDVGRSTPLALRGAAMAAMAWDLDRDGLLDLVVSHWEGATLQVFQNLGGGRFDDVSTTWGLSVDGMTWCTGIVDFDDDGGEDLYVVGDGAAHENLALRNTGPAPDGSPRFARVTPSGDPRQAARWFGTSDAGPMGLAFGWIDDDDRPDLVVASDLFSGPGLPVLSARTRGDCRSISAQFRLATEVSDTGAPMIPWSPRIWDFDHDGRADLLVPCGDDLGHGGGPRRGASRVLALRGGADGVLRDVTDALLPTRGHFMTPSLVDLDDDDDLDLVLGGFGQPWQVYRNDLTPRAPHTLLRLVGTSSNTDALGATVTVRVGAQTRRHRIGDLAAPQATELGPVDLALGAA
ncbi:MAG: FG-GAP-like repeat-containing protein, partial [Candidatus Nanopelagicales bacterium]